VLVLLGLLSPKFETAIISLRIIASGSERRLRASDARCLSNIEMIACQRQYMRQRMDARSHDPRVVGLVEQQEALHKPMKFVKFVPSWKTKVYVVQFAMNLETFLCGDGYDSEEANA